MSDTDLLTQREFDGFKPHPIMVDHIERSRASFGVPKMDFRIVDWGCGRGALVLWLRDRGYDTVGVDIDPHAPHLRLVEAHLFMPFVHWLPKNAAHKWLIGLFVLAGIEPRW
jgi:2-polyprenyl-3-methyl-5-hydroxy-6-metoxy-1,4-benzoquinol methylase